MIRFNCPACEKPLTAPDAAAGRSARCGCGAAFVIPGFEPVPALEIEYAPGLAPAGSEEGAAREEPGERPAPADPELASRPKRPKGCRRRTRWRRLGLAILTLAALVVAARVGVRVIGERATPGGPVSLAVNPDGPDWTYLELLEHLRARGLRPLQMRSVGGGQLYGITDDDYEMTIMASLLNDIGPEPGSFICDKMRSAQAAKELAGTRERGRFVWGRYCFSGPDKTLALVQRALTGAPLGPADIRPGDRLQSFRYKP
ncbi:MAG TPA: hypothetical protein VGE74_18315 [Gemmata sp.]